MKLNPINFLNKTTIELLLFLFFVFISCKKTEAPKDNIAPIITLNGKENDTIILSAPYTEIGAIAMDNKDGDISKRIWFGGDLNPYIKGNYFRSYSVNDAAGNMAITKNRKVTVLNQAEYLAGNYSAFCTSSYLIPDGSNRNWSKTYMSYTTTAVTSDVINNNVSLAYYPFENLRIDFNVKDKIISTNPWASGSGTISIDNKSFTLSTAEYVPSKDITRYCNCTFTKK